jgi:hypothetical protein
MVFDGKTRGHTLLNDWQLYKSARPKEHVVDIQLDKDNLQQTAYLLQSAVFWSNNSERIIELCDCFEQKLHKFKEKVILELLKSGTI